MERLGLNHSQIPGGSPSTAGIALAFPRPSLPGPPGPSHRALSQARPSGPALRPGAARPVPAGGRGWLWGGPGEGSPGCGAPARPTRARRGWAIKAPRAAGAAAPVGGSCAGHSWGGQGSAAAAPQRRDRRRPPPRCCFGTLSRSITTSTRPAATCGESRAAAALARVHVQSGAPVPRPSACAFPPGAAPRRSLCLRDRFPFLLSLFPSLFF